MLCEIEHHILKLDGPYGPSTARAICKTHGFDMSHMTRIWSGSEMCPIGQIEAARDEALAALGKPVPSSVPSTYDGPTEPALPDDGAPPEPPPKRTRKARTEPTA